MNYFAVMKTVKLLYTVHVNFMWWHVQNLPNISACTGIYSVLYDLSESEIIRW